ncbi:unnamed protein product [Colias eurytheme]|nr:unnamed protein product [Colias eurytheme]
MNRTGKRVSGRSPTKYTKTSLGCLCSVLDRFDDQCKCDLCKNREGAAQGGGVCRSSTGDRRVTHGPSSLTLLRGHVLSKKTADTVSVLQQAPGTIITRAPDEVQWACGGRRAVGACGVARRAQAPRATSGT